MFGIKKNSSHTTASAHADAPEAHPKGYTPKKGTKTRSRKEAEASRRRPLVADKTKLTREQRKERRAETRAANDREWRQQQEAMRTGDELRMPYQHRGKVRRFGRDFIDASSPLSTWFMPLAILLVPIMLLSGYMPRVTLVMTIVFYAAFLLMLIHGFIVATRAKNLAVFKFGAAAVPRGFTWQMLDRAFYLRRWRLPAVQVKRGEFPEGGRKEDIKAMRAAKKQPKNLGV